MNDYEDLIKFYKDAQRKEIAKENWYNEIRKYDTYLFSPMERSTVSFGKGGLTLNEDIGKVNFSYHCNFSVFKVEGKSNEENNTLVFATVKNYIDFPCPTLKISANEIVRVEKWITGRKKYDSNYILFFFKDGTSLSFMCHKRGKEEQKRIKKARELQTLYEEECD